MDGVAVGTGQICETLLQRGAGSSCSRHCLPILTKHRVFSCFGACSAAYTCRLLLPLEIQIERGGINTDIAVWSSAYQERCGTLCGWGKGLLWQDARLYATWQERGNSGGA